MKIQDFNARAALYLGSDAASAQAQGGREFRTAAHALRFALEEVAPISLRGASLVVGNLTFSGVEMVDLYKASGYPLRRKAALGNAGHTLLRKRAAQQFKQSNRSPSGATAPRPNIANQGVGFAV